MLGKRKHAFTLVELLVVIAIIGILIALLLPAVQAAREAARRSQCNNNIKQLVLAAHNYHDTFKAFPAGTQKYTTNQNHGPNEAGHFSWLVKLLPYSEQQPLFDQMDFEYSATPAGTDGNPSRPWIGTVLSEVLCPSDDKTPCTNSTPPPPMSPMNYVGCSGSDFYFKATNNGPAPRRGVFEKNFWPNMAAIRDGTANTVAISECMIATPHTRTLGSTADIAICAAGVDGITLTSSQGHKRGMSWMKHDAEVCLFNTLIPINDRLTENHECKRGTYLGAYAARSRHPGGVNAGMADGSVDFVSETIDLSIWQAASTIAGQGHEPVFSGF